MSSKKEYLVKVEGTLNKGVFTVRTGYKITNITNMGKDGNMVSAVGYSKDLPPEQLKKLCKRHGWKAKNYPKVFHMHLSKDKFKSGYTTVNGKTTGNLTSKDFSRLSDYED